MRSKPPRMDVRRSTLARQSQPDLIVLDIMLPGTGWLRGLPHPAPGNVRAHPHADRPRRRDRPRGRPGGGRRRLPDQALLHARADGARQGPTAPHPPVCARSWNKSRATAAPAQETLSFGNLAINLTRARGDPGWQTAAAQTAGIRTAAVLCRAHAARCSHVTSCWSASGAGISPATAAPWMCTCAGCARRSKPDPVQPPAHRHRPRRGLPLRGLNRGR